jgi:hypothetical protein
MSKVNDLLFSRLKQKFSKMTELAEVSSKGQLSSFSGVFKVHPLSDQEQLSLEELLKSYRGEAEVSIEKDLHQLASLTSEIKAINNQAAILHGERIKKAQEIFKNYRDGAFSAWLVTAYGNRQTPYNFLQYYEFYHALPTSLLTKLDEMPRQAVYTLASRNAPLDKKKELLENYQGETKNEVLELIRQTFPLEENDNRREDLTTQALQLIQKLNHLLTLKRFKPSATEIDRLKNQIDALSQLMAQLMGEKSILNH